MTRLQNYWWSVDQLLMEFGSNSLNEDCIGGVFGSVGQMGSEKSVG